MRIVGVAGSPRGKNGVTMQLVAAGVEGARIAGAAVETIDLASLRINRCKSCGKCYATGTCCQDDDLSYILRMLFDSDGLILGSPALAGGPTSHMESLMERMTDVTHCRSLEGRYGFSVSASGDGGEGFVVAKLNEFLGNCGVTVTGGIGVSTCRGRMAMNQALDEAMKLGGDLVIAARERRSYPWQREAKDVFLREFGKAVAANRELWAHDYSYWKEKGWI